MKTDRRRPFTPALALTGFALAGLSLTAGEAHASPFWTHWSDGRAELSGYTLVQPRYGELRKGRAVLIFVTEPWSRSRGVKVDRYDPQNPDHYTLLKLNVVRKFQTGIYDYSLLTSVFADPARGFAADAITFSAQEWCGHTFHDLRLGADGVASTIHSYFEGESGRSVLQPARPLAEDGLLIRLRQLDRATLDPTAAEGDGVPSLMHLRLKHRPAAVYPQRVTWAGPRDVTVPAGAFSVRTATHLRSDGATCEVDVERAYPRRIVGWRCSDGERAELTGSTRMAYWNTQREGDEAKLRALGLDAPPLHPPAAR
jgi:hypothetical protein